MTARRSWASRLYAHGIGRDLDHGSMTLEQALARLQTRLAQAKQEQFPELVRQVEWDIRQVERARLRLR